MNTTAVRYEGGLGVGTINLQAIDALDVEESAPETKRFPLAKTAASRLIHAEIANPRTRERLVASAIGILGNEADAEDCVQEAMILAAKNAEQFEGRSSPTSWLFRVVLNACRMQRRAMRRERRGGGAVHLSIDDLVVSHPMADATSDPEQAILGRDVLAVVVDELDRIPDKDAKLFERHVLEDLPLRTLAKESHLTRQAVKSRLFRVRRRIADRLEEAKIPVSA
jgi:RNA polymerase sigma-70 factor (ECF subfamily)